MPLFARLCENLTNLLVNISSKDVFASKQYLVRGRSNSEPISLKNIGKRVKEDESFEERESAPPANVERAREGCP